MLQGCAHQHVHLLADSILSSDSLSSAAPATPPSASQPASPWGVQRHGGYNLTSITTSGGLFFQVPSCARFFAVLFSGGRISNVAAPSDQERYLTLWSKGD